VYGDNVLFYPADTNEGTGLGQDGTPCYLLALGGILGCIFLFDVIKNGIHRRFSLKDTFGACSEGQWSLLERKS